MTKYQIQNKIQEHENRIESCRNGIRTHESRIEQYQGLQQRLESSHQRFLEFSRTHKNRIRTGGNGFRNLNAIGGYMEELAGYLEGKEFRKAEQDYTRAKEVLNCKKEQEQKNKEGLEGEISRHQEDIRYLNTKLTQMERAGL